MISVLAFERGTKAEILAAGLWISASRRRLEEALESSFSSF